MGEGLSKYLAYLKKKKKAEKQNGGYQGMTQFEFCKIKKSSGECCTTR